ncbi:MAG: carboxyl transferase domain-containing protein [Microthrixaceae bacterium]
MLGGSSTTRCVCRGRCPRCAASSGRRPRAAPYIPAFTDLVIMVEGNASMYLGSPRMAEMVIGEVATLEETGGARMHATVSGCGDNLAVDDEDAIAQARAYLTYLPTRWSEEPPEYHAVAPARQLEAGIVPDSETAGYDMHDVLDGLLDDESFFEIKALFAPEMLVGFGLLEGRPVGIVANNPMHKGGVIFTDSADKAARFIWLCDAFGVPLVFLADVPGFMIGTQVEREGIIRHGAKMITAVSEATVPKVSVVVRKAYGAGLYAMSGPAFEPEATLALPTAKIAVMGPEAAVNAVFANKIAAISDEGERLAFVEEQRRIYEEDVDLLRLASELVIDGIVDWPDLRREVDLRLRRAAGKTRHFSNRRHGVPPV